MKIQPAIDFVKSSRSYMAHLPTWKFVVKLPRAFIRFLWFSRNDPFWR